VDSHSNANTKPSLSIVMAAFNEQDALPDTVPHCLSFLREHAEPGELIIVNDGSTDGTADLLDNFAAHEPEVRIYHLPQNKGMGAALIRGFEAAKNDWVSILPADGQLDPFELLHFFEVAHDADLVTSLYYRRPGSLYRQTLSLGLRGLTTLIAGSRARCEGTYLIQRDVLAKLQPRSHSFMLNLEVSIRAQRAGYRVKTIHMHVHPRWAGVSTAATPRRIANTFKDLLRLRLRLEGERVALFLASRRGRKPR
jgi:glycosyltransferase involved in cell wall biosynthesis